MFCKTTETASPTSSGLSSVLMETETRVKFPITEVCSCVVVVEMMLPPTESAIVAGTKPLSRRYPTSALAVTTVRGGRT